MITFTEAASIARHAIPDDHVIIPDLIEEIDLGWYFMHESQRYIETGELEYATIGDGGILVCRTNGEVLRLGSSYPREYWFEAFRWGIHEPCDLTVTIVRDRDEAARLLAHLDLTYVIPKEEYGVVWKIPESYTEGQIREALRVVPCRFEAQKLIFRLHELQEMKASLALVFALSRSSERELPLPA